MGKSYYIKKVISSALVLFVIMVLNFFLPRMMFSDPATPYYAGVPEDAVALRNAIREEHGFNDPLYKQLLEYLKRVVTLNFGSSYIYKESVWSVIFSRIPWTLVLTLSSTVLSILIGIVFGSVAGKNRGKKADRALMSLSTITTAIPSFWLALLLIMLLSFIVSIFPYKGAMTSGYSLRFDVNAFLWALCPFCAACCALRALFKQSALVILGLPLGVMIALIVAIPTDDIADVMYHAALPIIVNVFSGSISYALLVRNSMIAVVNEDYILTARAKGLPPRTVLFKHTLKNALLPLITSVGMSMAGLIGGSVLIEQIFSWPGMGQLLLEACNHGDYLLSQAILLLFATITVVCNFITDLVYHRFDPRVKEV